MDTPGELQNARSHRSSDPRGRPKRDGLPRQCAHWLAITCKGLTLRQASRPVLHPGQRQAKRLRAETEATAYSTIASGQVQCPTIAMTSLVTVHRFSALAPFSSGPGADRLLFGKTKRRWAAHFAGHVLRTGSGAAFTPPPRVARHLPLQGRQRRNGLPRLLTGPRNDVQAGARS